VLTWASLILAVLKVINNVMDWANYQSAGQSGRDAEIAQVSAAILAKTQRGKAIMEQVNALSMDEVDRELLGLEPK
jgi:hypothetical protein